MNEKPGTATSIPNPEQSKKRPSTPHPWEYCNKCWSWSFIHFGWRIFSFLRVHVWPGERCLSWRHIHGCLFVSWYRFGSKWLQVFWLPFLPSPLPPQPPALKAQGDPQGDPDSVTWLPPVTRIGRKPVTVTGPRPVTGKPPSLPQSSQERVQRGRSAVLSRAQASTRFRWYHSLAVAGNRNRTLALFPCFPHRW